MAVESRAKRLKELFGDRLLHRSTTVSLDETTFSGSLIALYFVPIGSDRQQRDDQALRDLYDSANGVYKTLDIVQICYPDAVDDRERFDEMTNDVPWHAVLYDYTERRIRLRHKYNVGISETQVILNDDRLEKIYTKNCLKLIDSGKQFPWTDFWNDQIWQQTLKLSSRHDKETVYGLLFSAHWCPPCKAFIPQLLQAYNSIRKRYKFEIIFVSSDRSEQSFQSHASSMPWTSIPYADTALRQDLTECYNVRGIPHLVLVDSAGSVITESGRPEVADDPDGSYFPWKIRLVYALTSRLLPKLQSYPAIVLFIEGDQEEEMELAEGVLLPVAQQVTKTKQNPLYDLLFFIAPDDGTSDTLRNFARLTDDAVPLLTCIDIPMGRISIMEYGIDITEKSIMKFVDGFFDGTMKFTSIVN
ncbi:nucleoredoxin-like [Adelges cooleyi]|uniref:nucleoredoxin-like n=1 Tax=Adelges cooleyi TaxID=133065 RepID=UPI0021808803|nr:nucleoredoxin-like [Adelges cooleyi]